MHETFLQPFEFEFGRNPRKSLIQVPKIHNTKVVQFWKSKVWKNGVFPKDFKYQIFKILCFQKSPQISVFLSVLVEKDLIAKIPKTSGGYPKNLFLFPFFSSGQKAAGELPASPPPTPRPGRRLGVDKDPDAVLLPLSLPILSLSSLFLSEPRTTRSYPAAVIRRRRRYAAPLAFLEPPPAPPCSPLPLRRAPRAEST